MLATILVIALLIAVHEFGHFLAARRCGAGVDVFSIGFGPPIFSHKFRGTIYQIAAIPLGGYVKLRGFQDGKEDDPNGFYSLSKIRQAIIFAAGPVANLIFALVIAILMFWLHAGFSFQEAARGGTETTIKMVGLNLSAISDLVKGKGMENLSGPVGIIKAGKEMQQSFGFFGLVNLAFGLSISLGVLNLLPVPLLDGGHLTILGLEAIMRRKLTMRQREMFSLIGFMLLMGIFIFATSQDLSKIFSGTPFIQKTP